MTPTAAARASQPAGSSLRDRLKDPSLLREQCYIDGAWVGTPTFAVNNPATGVELAKVAQLGAEDTTRAVEAAVAITPSTIADANFAGSFGIRISGYATRLYSPQSRRRVGWQ